MDKLFLFFIILLSSDTFAQPTVISGKPGRMLTKKERMMDAVNRNCIHRNKYSAEIRNNFFPFNKAGYVELVSFSTQIFNASLPLRNGKVDTSRLKEAVTLNKLQVDILSDLLYNTGYKGAFYSIEESKCYMPRNAIVFIDRAGIRFAYIELCFGCLNYKKSSQKVKSGEFCQQKYELLKKFFSDAGVLYGTQGEYPGE